MDPESKLKIFNADTQSDLPLPCPEASIKAGFPAPAESDFCEAIDLNKVLVRHRESTFYARISGTSMEGAGISDGDLVIIDKAIEASDGDYVAAFVDGEFTVKEFRMDKSKGEAWLIPANNRYAPIRITQGNRFMIWGVITYVIKKLHR